MFSQLILNGIIAGSIYALISIGFAVIYRTVKFSTLLMVSSTLPGHILLIH